METSCGLWQIFKPLPSRMRCFWGSCFIVPGCWIFLSVALYLFVKLRADFAAIMDDADLRQWNFGQVLALMTWFPTVVDFVAVWSSKPPSKGYLRFVLSLADMTVFWQGGERGWNGGCRWV
jgi:hypothetical protein